MNRSLVLALALPSLMFYQSNAPILYSSEKLVTQVKEAQAMLSFDLSEEGSTLIISNERINETNETVESSRPPDHSKTSKRAESKSIESSLPKTGEEKTEQSVKKRSTEVLKNIEQKISALPLVEPLDAKNGEGEFVHMLANMSGTILYGTKITETNKHEYIIF